MRIKGVMVTIKGLTKNELLESITFILNMKNANIQSFQMSEPIDKNNKSQILALCNNMNNTKSIAYPFKMTNIAICEHLWGYYQNIISNNNKLKSYGINLNELDEFDEVAWELFTPDDYSDEYGIKNYHVNRPSVCIRPIISKGDYKYAP